MSNRFLIHLVKPTAQMLAAVLVFGSSLVRADGKPFLVISDFDDTIKISHSADAPDAFFRGVFGWDVYGGTPVEFRALGAQADLTVLSGSPELIHSKVDAVLDRQNFPARTLLLNPSPFQSTTAHKRQQLARLAAQDPRPMVLLGDNTERDPEVLTEFRRAHPAQVALLLIHRVTDAPIPDDAVAYYTAWEAAEQEQALGIITTQDALAVGQAVLASSGAEIIPEFAVCPSEGDLNLIGSSHGQAPELVEMGRRVAAQLAGICAGRQ